LGFAWLAYLFCEQFRANFSSQWLERKRLFRSIPCAHKSSATTTIRSSQDMKKRDAQEAITKKTDNEASARTKGRRRWAGPAPAHRVLPGPRSGRLLLFLLYLFTLI
jgi:hypothetical protein